MVKRSILEAVGPYIGRREALAEAVLLNILQSPGRLRRFARIAALDGRSELVEACRQEWACDKAARHDLVLRSSAGREFHVELKGHAPVTPRQRRALRLGNAASNKIRIDVFITPGRYKRPPWFSPSVRHLTSELIDRAFPVPGLGRLSDLWNCQAIFPRSMLTRDAREYASYRVGQRGEATWRSLWESISYLKSTLHGRLEFSRSDGKKKSGGIWYYGAGVQKGDRQWWLGWVFAGGQRGRFKIALVLTDYDQVLARSIANPLPEWCHAGEGGMLLWDGTADDATDIDMRAVSERLALAIRR